MADTSSSGQLSQTVLDVARLSKQNKQRKKKSQKHEKSSEVVMAVPAPTSTQSFGVEEEKKPDAEPNKISKKKVKGSLKKNDVSHDNQAKSHNREAKVTPSEQTTQKDKAQKPKGKKAQNTAKPKDSNRWWSKLRDVDPITLAPLSSLRAPPFELTVEGSDVKHRFDAKALAVYLLSTGKFVDPINRQEMTREDCLRLDIHLRQYGMGENAKCTEMLDLQNHITLRTDNQTTNEEAVANLRREAGVIASHLFHYPSLRENSRRDSQRNQRNTSGAGAVTVTDDDEQWQSTLPREVEDDFPDMPIVRRRTTEDDFPPIGGRRDQSRPIEAPRLAPSGLSWATVAETPRTRTIQVATPQEPAGMTSESSRWRALASERPRLNLVRLEPRGLPETSLPVRSESIFGKAVPVDNAHIFKEADRPLDTAFQNDFLCPYPPKLLRAARALGSSWLSAQEKKFKELLESGTSRKVLQLEPMAEPRRRLLQELAIRYWGFHVVEIDPEPYRFLELSITSSSFAPDLYLHRALVQYPNLHAAEFSNAVPSNGLLLFGCSATTTTNRVHDLMRDVLQARESEYDIRLLESVLPDERNVFIEVSSNERARKFYKKLTVSQPVGFRYRKIEWFPAGVEWAKFQIKELLKVHEDELEPIRAQRRLDEKRMKAERLANTGDTAWDDEGPEVGEDKINVLRAKLQEKVDWDDDAVSSESSDDDDSDSDSDDSDF